MLVAMVSGIEQKHVLQTETDRLVSYTEREMRRPGNPKTAEGLLQGQQLVLSFGYLASAKFRSSRQLA